MELLVTVQASFFTMRLISAPDESNRVQVKPFANAPAGATT